MFVTGASSFPLAVNPQAFAAAHAFHSCTETGNFPIANGLTVTWRTGGFVYTPPWTWHRHYNTSDADPVEFLTIENSRLLGALGVNRRQSAGLVTVAQAREMFQGDPS